MSTNPWVLELFSSIRKDFLHTGSRVICSPSPTDTDDDYLILLNPEHFNQCNDYLIEQGYEVGGSLSNLVDNFYDTDLSDKDSAFRSYKRSRIEWDSHGNPSWIVLNIILTISEEFFLNFKLATALCKKLNLVNKADRIAVFEACTYDRWPLHVLEEV